MMNSRIILLAGPKHCGKTSAGKILAEITKQEFFDLDEMIETAEKKTVRELYRQGAGIFKKAETGAVKELLAKNLNCVTAAGGGLIDNSEAMEMIAGSPQVRMIYIEVPAATAWKRIKQSGGLPAFLDPENPEKSHLEIHERRARLYKSCSIFTIMAEGKSPRELALEIAGKLEQDTK